MVLIAYNRVDVSMIGAVLLFWFTAMWFFGNLMRYYTFAKVVPLLLSPSHSYLPSLSSTPSHSHLPFMRYYTFAKVVLFAV